MVILGLLLVLIALALGAALIVGTSAPEVSGQEVDISFFDTVTISLAPLTLVVAGMVAMFVLWLGLVLIKVTLSRKARARKQRKEQEAEARQRQVRLEHERAAAAQSQHPAPAAETTRIRQEEAGADPNATRPIRPGETDPNATRPIRPGETDTSRPGGGDDTGGTRPVPKDPGSRG